MFVKLLRLLRIHNVDLGANYTADLSLIFEISFKIHRNVQLFLPEQQFHMIEDKIHANMSSLPSALSITGSLFLTDQKNQINPD